jgi:hypothetical protein
MRLYQNGDSSRDGVIAKAPYFILKIIMAFDGLKRQVNDRPVGLGRVCYRQYLQTASYMNYRLD